MLSFMYRKVIPNDVSTRNPQPDGKYKLHYEHYTIWAQQVQQEHRGRRTFDRKQLDWLARFWEPELHCDRSTSSCVVFTLSLYVICSHAFCFAWLTRADSVDVRRVTWPCGFKYTDWDWSIREVRIKFVVDKLIDWEKHVQGSEIDRRIYVFPRQRPA